MLSLLPIDEKGRPVGYPGDLPPEAAGAAAAVAEGYSRAGFRPPWIGYLAEGEGVPVGTCAFKGAPVAGRVEIVYFTFPAHEGRGFAKEMARRLVALARAADPGVVVIARTPPEEGPSTAVLRRLGFRFSAAATHPGDGAVWEWLLETAPPG